MSVKVSCTAGGNGKWYNYFRKQFGSLSIRDIKGHEETFRDDGYVNYLDCADEFICVHIYQNYKVIHFIYV